MDYCNLKCSSLGAIRLLYSRELCLSDEWSLSQAESLLNKLLSLSYEEILGLLDGITVPEKADTGMLPQFGTVETLINVPYVVKDSGLSSYNYAQIGFFLKKDPDANLLANSKYGETHSKGAMMMGLVSKNDDAITKSCLTNAFCLSYQHEEQIQIVSKLFFRITIIQMLFKHAKKGKINGYALMQDEISESTKIRRAACLKGVLKFLYNLNDKDLNVRIDNIYWEI